MNVQHTIHLVTDRVTGSDDAPEELESHYHCSAEWHLAKLSPMCAPLYSFALRISRGHEGRFFCSAVNLAHYFGYDESTIRRALNQLHELGFLQIWRRQKFQPNNYRVVDHTQWAEAHPNQCVAKADIGWSDGQDLLGQELFVETGGRVKWRQFQIDNLRRLGLSDARVALAFREFYKTAGHDWKQSSIPTRFYAWLKKREVAGAA